MPSSTVTAELPRRTGRRSGAQLVLLLECERPLTGPARHDLSGLDSVAVLRGLDRLARREDSRLVLEVPDQQISKRHAQLRRGPGGPWLVEDAGSKNGVRVNGERVERRDLRDGDLIETGRTFWLFRASGGGTPDVELPELSTLHPELGEQLAHLRTVAASDVSVIIRGESGTGKEVAARALHRLSGRAGPFQAVNCGALAPTLVESELFGHRKGAFSGATEDRPGLVRAADGGTLLLDEIGDLPRPAQATLLRVLQEREVLPVGASRPVPVDLRVVAATHRDLDELAARERFRPDLLARLSGFTLTIPPLRERREDLGVLVPALLRRFNGEKATFTADAARALLLYGWPLNVRELEKCLSAAVVLAGAAPIDAAHLPEAVRSRPQATPVPELSGEDAERREQLVALLREHRGNVTAVARAMGKARVQIQRWIRRYGIDLAVLRG